MIARRIFESIMSKSSVAVIGMQWGDEGKGKVIDLLAEKADHIVRAQGGNNAGHTIVAKGQEFRFHLIPSGILYPHTQCYIGGGTVLDPESFLAEIDSLKKEKVNFEKRLFISQYVHVVFPYHKLFDRLSETSKGKSSLGTTGRGIGPCYADKINRIGIRIADLMLPDSFRKKLEAVLSVKNLELQKIYQQPALDLDVIFEKYQHFAEQLKPYVAPVEQFLYEATKKGEKILFEGAQGALLDVTFGTYPFVTSSCTLAGGVCSGSGFGPSMIQMSLGVAKAYTTRVGNGPLPTELQPEELTLFPDAFKAREIGTTTGRKRRIGWLDAFLLKHTVYLNGVDSLAFTKLDILDELDEIKICTGYKGFSSFPATTEELMYAVPSYEVHPGWKENTKDITVYENLPLNAKKYLQRIEELCGVPISILSVGPDREKTIWIDRFFTRDPI